MCALHHGSLRSVRLLSVIVIVIVCFQLQKFTESIQDSPRGHVHGFFELCLSLPHHESWLLDAEGVSFFCFEQGGYRSRGRKASRTAPDSVREIAM